MKPYHSILVTFISKGLLELKSLSFIYDNPKVINYSSSDDIETQLEKYLISKEFSIKGKTYINQGIFVVLVKEFKKLT